MANKYRLILVFDAASDQAASTAAQKAASDVKATESRLTSRRETWGNLAGEPATEAAT